eukprot:5719239-Amphidinium_carterae.1
MLRGTKLDAADEAEVAHGVGVAVMSQKCCRIVQGCVRTGEAPQHAVRVRGAWCPAPQPISCDGWKRRVEAAPSALQADVSLRSRDACVMLGLIGDLGIAYSDDLKVFKASACACLVSSLSNTARGLAPTRAMARMTLMSNLTAQ